MRAVYDRHVPTAVGKSRFSVGLIVVIVAVNLWLVTMAWFRLPAVLFGAQGQLYALWPFAVLGGVVTIVLALAGLIVCIVEAVGRRIGWRSTSVTATLAAFTIVVSPLLLWFGGFPV